MTKITTDDVLYVARLAKIALRDDEAAKFTKELDAILGYVQQLDAVDTTGLQPTYQVTGLTNITRNDAIIDYGTHQQDLLKNVPRTRDGYIEVPKVL
jgi:aspartyl-tRNA(Asn)/glutamyl-tRNA(Gln) amidotransferase subunit C